MRQRVGGIKDGLLRGTSEAVVFMTEKKGDVNQE